MNQLCPSGVRFREELGRRSWPWHEGPRVSQHGGEVVEPTTFVATIEPPTGDSRSRIRVLVDDHDVEIWIGGCLRRAFASDHTGFEHALQLIQDFCAERTVVVIRRRSFLRELLASFAGAFGRPDVRDWQPVSMRPRRRLGGLLPGTEVLVPVLLRVGSKSAGQSQVSWLGTYSSPTVGDWPA